MEFIELESKDASRVFLSKRKEKINKKNLQKLTLKLTVSVLMHKEFG